MTISSLLPYCRFHALRLFRSHPVIVATCVASLLLLVASALAFLNEAQELAAAQEQLHTLRSATRRSPAADRASTPTPQGAPNLPWFRSAQLVEEFSHAAEDSKLPFDEVGYVLEEGANHPYLRYRVTMTVSASYPAIRQFVDEVSATMAHVDLDSIACTRADIVIAPLTCELAFSAFFRKGANG